MLFQNNLEKSSTSLLRIQGRFPKLSRVRVRVLEWRIANRESLERKSEMDHNE